MKKGIKNLKLYNKKILISLITAIGISEGSHCIIESVKNSDSDISSEYNKNDDVYDCDIDIIDNSDTKKGANLTTKGEIKIVDRIEKYPKNTFGYITKDSDLKKEYDKNSTCGTIKKYQKVKLIENVDSYILVKGDNKKGYINENNIEKIESDFVDVDISKQTIIYYDDTGKKILSSSVVTGLASSDDRKTPIGIYSIYMKQKDRTLRGSNYTSHVNYWMPFYEGYGLHDANWRSEFGGEIYKTNGSHGCVNLPNDIAKELYEELDVGTKVLVHK